MKSAIRNLQSVIVLCFLFLCSAVVHGDGATLRFSKQVDAYRITLFTSPTSLRAGVVDFSVLVQAADSQTVLLDVPVTVHAYPEGGPQRRIGGPATIAAATNKLFRAISLELPEPGRWHVEVTVGSSERPERVQVELELGAPLPSWLDLALWIGWPAVAILLFVIHQRLARRRTDLRSAPPSSGALAIRLTESP